MILETQQNITYHKCQILTAVCLQSDALRLFTVAKATETNDLGVHGNVIDPENI